MAKNKAKPDEEVATDLSKNRNKSTAPVKYLVNKLRGEDVVVEIPANWKLTFSSVNPNSAGGRHEGYCLRLYEGTKLRAVIGDVTGFRDLGIPLVRKIKSEVGATKWESDSLGNMKEEREVKVNTQFVLESGADVFDDEDDEDEDEDEL